MKTNETGHYKNIVGLNALKVFAEGLGAEYNPQKEVLKLSNVALLADEANALHDAVRNQTNTVSLSIDHRQLVFENVKPLSTRVINTMSSTNVNPKTIVDAKFFNAKIQGTRISKKPVAKDGKEESPSNSVSRQSYDSIYENFKSMNDLLIQDGNYKPTEADLNNNGLTIKQNEMLAANSDINIQTSDLGQKRLLRNSRFYVGDDCLIAVGRGIKKYIRGKYGIHSAEWAQIRNINFKDYRIK
ncbi:MAG TPA: hypothetical protein PKN96_11995 [Flavobacterium sp.]|uniref:hypothetical protein n=1 Tax=Flavobacterium sp. TaxID=239 RepID=UPI002C804011|nr:hypothetical protein [Flavobacterium sp.]HNP34005.1 hypothetical protein [Flavobacterium sp.]